MNLLKVIFVLFLFVGGAKAAWSSCDEENAQAHITLLKNAAAALAQSRPDLAAALNSYADEKTKGSQDLDLSTDIINAETQKVQAVASQIGNAILSKDKDTLEGLMYSNPSVAFNGTRKQSWEMVRDYHDGVKNHELLNFNIVNVRFSDDLTEAGVVVKEFFSGKDGATREATEGWTFRKDNPQNEWRFVGISFSAKDKDH